MIKKSFPQAKSPYMPRILWLVIFCYAVIYIVWGSTYYFIKLSVQSIPPVWVVGLRFFFGGLAILLVCGMTKRIVRPPSWKEWRSIIFLGICLIIGGNMLVTIAQKKVDSYLAALIISCTPIAVAVFNRLFFSIRLPWVGILGIGISLSGVALLLYDGHSFGTSFSPSIVMLLMALCLWAFATCMSSRLQHYPDVFTDSALQMMVAGGICCLIAPFAEGGAWIHSIRTESYVGVLYLAIIGSLAFAAYNYLLLVEPPQRISTYAFVNPLVATLLGILLAHEEPVLGLWFSLPAIVVGVVLLIYGRKIGDWFKR